MVKTPVLFLVFNRPEKTRRVFEEIKKAKPEKLFIAADGPRQNIPEDLIKCQEVRSIVENVDWDCSTHYLFRDNNLGCKNAVSAAITWFFEQVEEGIILEDDCLPDQSFFWFSQKILEKYRHDTRIMHICGSNFQFGQVRGDGSYYFSKLPHVWGWATWKRAWQYYDVNIKPFPEFLEQKCISGIFADSSIQKRYLHTFERVYRKEYDNWDPQWIFTVFVNNGLTVIPNVNLITNIGFGLDATEFSNEQHKAMNMKRNKIDKIASPSFIIPNQEADLFSLKKVFDKPKLWRRMFNKLQKFNF